MLLWLMNMGFAGGGTVQASGEVRGGPRAHGRGRLRGRRLWWLVLLAVTQWRG